MLSHVHLLVLVFWSQHTFVSLLEIFLVGVYHLENLIDVALESMRVNIEGAEGLEKLKHLLNAFANHQRHLSIPKIVELQQVGVSCGSRHEHGKLAIEGIDQRMVDIKDDVQA